jgi:hypothetical protein
MTGFSIAFTGESASDDAAMAVGEIRLGEHRESFHAEIGFWTVQDYQDHWRAALRRLLSGAAVSCLVTSLSDPHRATFLTTWPLYRDHEEVHVQNRLVFLDELLPAPFAPAAPWESVDPRTTVDEKGRPVSEWHITLTDIEIFLRTPAPGAHGAR